MRRWRILVLSLLACLGLMAAVGARPAQAATARVSLRLMQSGHPVRNQQLAAYNYQQAYERLRSGAIPQAVTASTDWQKLQKKQPADGATDGISLSGHLILARGVTHSSQASRAIIRELFATGHLALLQRIEGANAPDTSPDGLYNEKIFINFTDKNGITTDTIPTGLTLFCNNSNQGEVLSVAAVTARTSQMTLQAKAPAPVASSTAAAPAVAPSTAAQKLRIAAPLAILSALMLAAGLALVLKKEK